MSTSPSDIEAHWARQRAKEHLALVGFIHVCLVVGIAATFFAGGDLGRIASGFLALAALVTTVDLIRTTIRLYAPSPSPSPTEETP